MEKIPAVSGYINRLSVAIFMLTISICASATVVLAFMPTIRDLSYELTLVHWAGFRLATHSLLEFLLVVAVGIMILRILSKKPTNSPPTKG